MSNSILSVSKLAKSARKEVKDMRGDLEKRIDGILSLLKEKGPEAVAKAEQSLSELREDLENRLTDIRDSIDDTVETGRKGIQEYPLMSVGIAVGLGIIIGLLLGRKSKD